MRRKKIKVLAGRIIFIAAMVCVIAAFVLYQQGYYDFVFIQRESNAAENDDSETTSEIIPDIEETENPETIGTEPVDENNPETNVTPTESTPDYKELTAKIESAKNYLESGWSITEKVYNRNSHKITAFTLPVTTEKIYSYRNEVIESKFFNDETGLEETTTKSQKLPVIRSYMGYILINNEDKTTSVYNPKKNIINRNLSEISPAYMRDAESNPLFFYGGEFHIINADSRLQPAEVQFTTVPGLFGNYPSYYGKPNSGLYLYYDERTISRLINAAQAEAAMERGEYVEPIYVDEVSRLYGYKNENGIVVIPARYVYAYNFSDNGLAVVADRNRTISVINTYGTTVFTAQNKTLRIPELSDRIIYDGYYLPVDFSMDQRGMLYFNNGLLRVRRVITEFNTLASILRESSVLLKPDGSIFDIPFGYEIVSYSDGVAVVKNGDYYGCFSHTGKWIAQPIYTYAGMFNEGLAVVGEKNGKKGVIDTNGNTVLPFVYDEISDVSGGVIAAYEKQYGWSVYTKIARGEG